MELQSHENAFVQIVALGPTFKYKIYLVTFRTVNYWYTCSDIYCCLLCIRKLYTGSICYIFTLHSWNNHLSNAIIELNVIFLLFILNEHGNDVLPIV